ncbi:dihydroxyacetone kinase subunit DhaL [Mycolicibacterium sp. CBMA 226]|uniref:dihydroxyacetone kinase subunit DhaL n=1 Tax=Mycolicibacterium sp. CBMA 226 TaxID=2606611 RepID=UPI0012DFBFBC|nr:dihydroxyacetone kinase subunit DhaL [Mycolicibacterium sp. CBMA 226]MUL79052.1 dihydroxyacetone kinase subunit L [Mycolicibacterium sp. CBMA 226]QGW61376.1 PEP-dependent dihydroxyacetone kinase, ADP-binding subunit DhaL [Mycolicibacterium sp.]
MSTSEIVEVTVRAMADTAIAKEDYFCELDAVSGDGDFGFSLARGFEVVLENWDDLDRDSDATFLRRVATIITSRTGGTSGPIWGTGFLRAAAALAKEPESARGTAVAAAALRASITGIMERGRADVGDKTLLDALVPALEALESAAAEDAPLQHTVQRVAIAARAGAEATKELQARRGRASYTGERSIGGIDPGATAIAIMLEELATRVAGSDVCSSALTT